MREWSWVPDRRLRRRLQASTLTPEARLAYPRYLFMDQVLTLWPNSISPTEYRRRIRAVSRTVRGYGGDQHDVTAARAIVVVAAEHDIPLDDALTRLKADGAILTVLSIRAQAPAWFVSHFFAEANDNPTDVGRFYRRLTTLRNSSPELVRALIEETEHDAIEILHENVRAWASLRLPVSTVRLLLRAKISAAEVQANPRLATNLDGLRLIVTLQDPSSGLDLMLQAA